MLLEKLEGEGPFTVFAPTNEAFVALLAEKGVELEDVIADKEALTKLLKAHVVDGKVMAADIIAMEEPKEARALPNNFHIQIIPQQPSLTCHYIRAIGVAGNVLFRFLLCLLQFSCVSSPSSPFLSPQQIETLAGNKVPIEVTEDGEVVLGKTKKAKVINADVEAKNGVVHVIDAVAEPEDDEAAMADQE